jgi:hypothetical protein
MKERGPKSKTVTGLIQGARAAEAILISIVLFAGAIIAAGQSGSYPPTVGWILLSISGVVLAIEINKWVRIVPGIFGYGLVIALHAASSGHMPGHPSISFSWVAGIITVSLYAAITLVSLSFVGRDLSRVDKLLLLTFVALILWGYVSVSMSASLIRMGIALCCLIIAYCFNRFQQRENRSSQVSRLRQSL